MKWEIRVWDSQAQYWMWLGGSTVYATRGWALCRCAILNATSDQVYRVFPHDEF